MRSQKPQYYYDPPPGIGNWLERLKPLKEPPLAYIIALVGIVLGIVLSLTGSVLGPRILVLLIAFPIHELSHALVADRLGDSTPRYYGRITLNPIAQLNLIGSILMLFVGVGWAYVPINPSSLRPNPRTGHMIVAAAGPISNLILAALCAILWHVSRPALQTIGNFELVNNLLFILFSFASINVMLFFFNLVPIVPLDGFFVLKGILPYNLAYRLEALQRYGMLIFLAVFFLLPLMGVPILDWFIFSPAEAVTELLFFGI